MPVARAIRGVFGVVLAAGAVAGAWYVANLPSEDEPMVPVVAPGPRLYEVKRWFASALPIVLVWSLYTMLCYADVLVLQQFRPPQEVGHYYAAAKTLMLVGFIHFSMSAAVAHRFTALHVAGDHTGLAAFVAKTVRWTFL